MKKEIIWSLIVGLATIFLGQGILMKAIYKPQLSYEILPTLRLPNDETHSVIVKNTGRSMLHNVIITFNADKPLAKLRIDGPEIIDQTGESYKTNGKLSSNYLQLTLSRVIQESNIPITFSTPQNTTVDIVVASNETSGVKVEPKTKAGVLDYTILLVGAFALGFYVYATLKQRRLVTRGSCTAARQESGKKLKKTLTTHTKSLAVVKHIIEKTTRDLGENERAASALRDVCSVLDLSIESLQSFADSIALDGVCVDFSDKKQPQPADLKLPENS